MSDHNYYKVGGSLEYQHPTYVVRQADHDLYEGLKNGEFCYVLNSRQMGKSSLRVQTMKRLKAEGVKCAAIDMSRIGSHVTPAEWYGGIVSEMIRGFNLSRKIDFSSWWRERDFLSPVHRLSDFIEDILLTEFAENIVIFIDEIDSILKVDFKCDFFAFIRGCYNRRPDNAAYNRLTFCLLGVATPSDLITDKFSTPFNIGQAIELTGFQLEEAEPLSLGLKRNVEYPMVVLAEILAWTGGQPFLTQKLCKLIAASKFRITKNQVVPFIRELVYSRILTNWEMQDEPEHLRTIRDRILHSPRQENLLDLYQKILQGGELPIGDRVEELELRLSGLVVKQGSKLTAYNQIYMTVFNQIWIEKLLPKSDPRTRILFPVYAPNLPRNQDVQQIVKHLLNMKQKIDSIVANDEKIQIFLAWVNEKSLAIKSPIRPAAIRAFYFDFALKGYWAPDLDFRLARFLDADFPKPSILSAADTKHLIFDHEFCLDLNLTPGLDVDRSSFAHVLEADLSIALEADLHLQPQFKTALERLKAQLPIDEDRETWWQSYGQSWVEKLRRIMIRYRNIGHNWQFTNPQKGLLDSYYFEIQRLVDFWDKYSVVDTGVWHEVAKIWNQIEASLLMPQKIVKDNHQQLQEQLQFRDAKAIAECQKWGLADRECQVWLLYKKDYRLQEIAEELYIGFNTVKKHLKNIRSKIRASDTLDTPKTVTSISGINYSQLRDLLAQQKWLEADLETERIMLKLANRETEGWLRGEDIARIPCNALLTIDRLWGESSNNHFSFSAQKEIWQSTGGIGNPSFDTYETFGRSVGWQDVRENGSIGWLYYRDLRFDISAPRGHLPGKILDWLWSSFSEHTQANFSNPSINSLFSGWWQILSAIAHKLDECCTQSYVSYRNIYTDATVNAECQKYGLSDCEREIWQLRRAGFSYEEIAEVLQVSRATVQRYVKHIYAKFHGLSKNSLILDKSHILWVDDQPTHIVKEIARLRKQGIEITHATSTTAALKLLSDNQGLFKAVITDMGRTEEDKYQPQAGIALIKEIRKAGIDLPILVYTTLARYATTVDEVVKAGANGATMSAEELVAWVKDHIK